MRISLPVLAVVCSSITTAFSSTISRTHWLPGRVNFTSTNPYAPANCTAETAYVRKEWRTLSKPERRRYIDAVLCLKKKPSLYPEIKAEKGRFDDFQLVHINNTFIIHFDAQFLAWHRWFVWTYDQTLRKECGYRGYQPYWDWTLDGQDLEASPLLDGSEYSLSGNGEFIPNRTTVYNIVSIPSIPFVNQSRPAGTGGGCVTTGPFANMQVPFGPFGEVLNTSLVNNPANLNYRPHCLRRDLATKITSKSFTTANVEHLLASPNITTFNSVLEFGDDPSYTNLHAAGHFGIGGDMRDTFSSPADPIFYLHHAQVDRLWTLWQNRNLAERQYAISGTGTMFNYPASPEFQLNDTISLEKLSPSGPRPIREFLNTLGGPFCYRYE